MHTVSVARRALVRLAPVVVTALLVASCSGGASGGIKVSDPWARASQAVDGAGAAYMVIQNTSSETDTLIGGSSPAAGAVEVHETVDMSSPDPMASGDGMGAGSPMMGMQRIERLEIPAGGSVELKPGSYHVMLIGLTQPLEAGQKIEITLTFEKAGDVKVTAEVREG